MQFSILLICLYVTNISHFSLYEHVPLVNVLDTWILESYYAYFFVVS